MVFEVSLSLWNYYIFFVQEKERTCYFAIILYYYKIIIPFVELFLRRYLNVQTYILYLEYFII